MAHLNTKYDWYQNSTHVFLTFKVVGDKELAKRTKIDFQEKSVTLHWDEESFTIPLSNSINADICESYPFSQKLELKLVKHQANVNWLSLEPGKGVISNAQPVNTIIEAPKQVKPYASSKNWDKIDQELKKDLEAEKPEGEAALNGLFKQIYERADENTRRAMMKSYQTSGGTVLSTNWDEVASKDYEGKDRPDAPDGQMWADQKK